MNYISVRHLLADAEFNFAGKKGSKNNNSLAVYLIFKTIIMTEKLNLTLSELGTVKSDFNAKYQAADPNISFPWDIKINWIELVNAVEGSISWQPEETVLRFIHRYDSDGWFLTMECCHVADNGEMDFFGSRFDLRDNQSPALSSFTANFDQYYFDNVNYNGNPLIRGTHVNYLRFPWSQELKETAKINGVIDSEDTDIVFSSITFDYGDNSTKVNVRFPHTLALFYANSNGDLLDNVDYGGTFIKLKAYDYAQPCPTDCSNVYVFPTF